MKKNTIDDDLFIYLDIKNEELAKKIIEACLNSESETLAHLVPNFKASKKDQIIENLNKKIMKATKQKNRFISDLEAYSIEENYIRFAQCIGKLQAYKRMLELECSYIVDP